VGLLLQELARAGVMERTVVVFVSDHGAPFSRAKTTTYEAGVGVPLIIHWPGAGRAGLRSEALVSTVDLMPTLLEAARIAPPRTEGRSLRPLLSGSTPAQWRGLLFSEYNAHAPEHLYPRRAVRTARFKLIHNLDSACRNPLSYIGTTRLSPTVRPAPGWNPAYRNLFHPPEFELYDLRVDPFETNNLANRPQQAERLANLQAALLRWRQRTGDPLLEPTELPRLKAALGVGCVNRR
jgi:N-sulfoglucosamine sulfohydrolase